MLASEISLILILPVAPAYVTMQTYMHLIPLNNAKQCDLITNTKSFLLLV